MLFSNRKARTAFVVICSLWHFCAAQYSHYFAAPRQTSPPRPRGLRRRVRTWRQGARGGRGIAKLGHVCSWEEGKLQKPGLLRSKLLVLDAVFCTEVQVQQKIDKRETGAAADSKLRREGRARLAKTRESPFPFPVCLSSLPFGMACARKRTHTAHACPSLIHI